MFNLEKAVESWHVIQRLDSSSYTKKCALSKSIYCTLYPRLTIFSRLKQVSLCLFLLFAFSPMIVCAQTEWRELAPHIAYTAIEGNAEGRIHAFKFALAHNLLDIGLSDRQGSYIEDIVAEHDAIIGINGGFFTPDFIPLGLRVAQGRVINPIHNTSWWGIFYLQDGVAGIQLPSEYKQSAAIDFAVQAGPRLVINGHIPTLRAGVAERSALCLDKMGQEMIILITEYSPMSTTQLATRIAAPERDDGLNCYNALNLDGGRSSQLYAHIGDFKLHIKSIAAPRMITDGLLVLPQGD